MFRLLILGRCPGGPAAIVSAWLLIFSLSWSDAYARTVSLQDVQRLAEEHSLGLKIADSDIALQRIAVQEARTSYYPGLSLRYDLGYAWALEDEADTVTIGDGVSAGDLSTWRNSFSLSSSMVVYDGGAREQRQVQARHGVRAARHSRADQRQQLQFEVLDTYLKGLQAQEKVSALSQIVALCKRRFRAMERLQSAGVAGQMDLQAVALELATQVSRLDEARLDHLRTLAMLSELTGRDWSADDLSFSPFESHSAPPPRDVPVEKLPRIKAIDEELASLRAERSAAWRELFPSIGIYGNYRWYGADADSGVGALEDLRSRDATVALTIQWQFSGGRDRLQLARLDERLRRLNWKRRQSIAQIRRELAELQQAAEFRPVSEDHAKSLLQSVSELDQTTERLRERGVVDEPTMLARRVELLEKELETVLQRHLRQAAQIRLQIWQEGLGL